MAETSQIVDVIEALAVHFRPPLMDVEGRKRWLRDWCDDLKGFDIEHVRSATAMWRHGDSGKFPSPGQLLPLVRASIGAPAPSSPIAEAWRELTDAEYQALSLTDKIRHQRILASEARGKAGPMWKNGRAAGPDELPPRWHTWTAIANNHDAEAGRLRKALEDAQHRRENAG